MECLKVPALTVLTSTLLMHTVCWKLLLLGSHEITTLELVTFDAFTHDGPSGASFPMIMVHAASLDVFRLTRTERTLIRCGWKKMRASNHDCLLMPGSFELTRAPSTPSTRAFVLSVAFTVVRRKPST